MQASFFLWWKNIDSHILVSSFTFLLKSFFDNKFSNVPKKILLVFIFLIFSLIFALIFHFHSLNFYHFGIPFLEFNHPFSFDVDDFYRVSKVSYLLHFLAVYLYIQTHIPISLFLSTGKKIYTSTDKCFQFMEVLHI